MSYLVLASGVIQSRTESLADAVLEATRSPGGNGAYYHRTHDGAMILFLCDAQGPAYDVRSIKVDDFDAMHEVASGVMARQLQWTGAMAGKQIMQVSDYLADMLQAALENFEGPQGPGEWMAPVAHPQMDGALMLYRMPNEQIDRDPYWNPNDNPWSQWGGMAMINAVGGRVVAGYIAGNVYHAVVTLGC